MLVSVKDGIVKTKPIAGTMPRGKMNKRISSLKSVSMKTLKKEQNIQCWSTLAEMM